MKPISIVTVVRNDLSGMRTTFNSVKEQTARKCIQYIVIDGASTDGTTQFLNEVAPCIDVIVSEPDKGIYDAMNKGIKIAEGEWILFLNAGDTLHSPTTVEEVFNSFERNASPHPAMVYGKYCERRPDGSLSKPIPCRNPDKIWYGPIACHQSIFYNSDFLWAYRLTYDTNYRIAADYKLTLQLLKANIGKAVKTDVIIADFSTDGTSNANQNLGLREANRARREVLGWSRFRTGLLTGVLLSARFLKKYFRPLYNLIRLK